MQVAPDTAEAPSLVPHHQVLLTTFELKSKAFMLTYNSDDFSLDTWAPFKLHMETLHEQHGSKAFAGCLEESLHATTGQPAAGKFHTHGYLLWTDGIGYRSESLEDFRFQGVLPRVDKCTATSNMRAPRQAALHGLWYVAVVKKGTRRAHSNFTPWVDYKPSKEWLISLWDSHKLDHQSYVKLSAHFRSGPRLVCG